MTEVRTASLVLIGLLLLGYVLGDRGFAHLSISSVYIGEIVLGLSLLLYLLRPQFKVWLMSRAIWALAAFDIWCLLCTAPFVEGYQVDALRDSVVYAYSAFAFLIVAAIARPELLVNALQVYGHAITFSVIVMPVLLYVTPTTHVRHEDLPLIFVKAGDAAVHLAGAATFRLIGLHAAVFPVRLPWQRVVDAMFWTSWAISVLWTMAGSRGAMLAMGAAMVAVTLFGFIRRQAVGFMAVLAVVFTLLDLLSIGIGQERRDISVAQVVGNVSSILALDDSMTGDDELGSTLRWRLRWWQDIIDYTVFGDNFWTGHGFGVNLADADRYQADPEGQLRSPHNAHLTILARTGVPGLVLWLAFLGVFGYGLIATARRARREGLPNWHRLHVWIFAYWMAALVNASFDVYLEGPQGGIWFWSITGFGIAALALAPAPQRTTEPA
ncbi:MAG: O-antigen ligase family protein [Alphaproteobacteria bacterium]